MNAIKRKLGILKPSPSQINLDVHGDTIQEEPSDIKDGIPPKEENNVSRSCGNYLTSDSKVIAFYVVVVILLVSGLPFLITHFIPLEAPPSDAGVCSVNDQFRFECFPDVLQLTDQKCDEWNCCWFADEKAAARCYHRFPSSYRLNTTEGQELPSPTNSSRRVVLNLQPLDDLPTDLGYDNKYKEDTRLTMVVEKVNRQHVRARILLNPTGESQAPLYDESDLVPDVTEFDYEVHYDLDYPRRILTFHVMRPGANYSLFNLNNGGGLVLSKNYAEATILLPPTCSIFGLGLGNHQQLRHTMNWKAWALFSNYTDFSEGSSFYGTHPVYLCLEDDGQAHGVVFNNSYLMEARLQPAPAVTFRTVGGNLDFHIVLGPRPIDVVTQLSQVTGIGKPAMPPYWALGYHICPATNKLATAMDIVQQMVEYDIPFESSCIDAEIWRHWMKDPSGERVKQFNEYSQYLKDNNRHTLVVAFPQVLIHKEDENTTDAYKKGIAKDIFLKEPTGNVYLGLDTLNSDVTFLDPTHPETIGWLSSLMKPEETKHFDGFLLHWNTPTDITNRTAYPCESSLNHPPFLPKLGMSSMSQNTLCMDVRYYSNDTHAAMHNQYGRRHAELMYKLLVATRPTKRPFLLSLSTQTGSGATSGHWGGDYVATWEGLKNSLVNVLEASMYSMPLSGVPIAGNTGHVKTELWTRWYQLGAFYPLALSYYDVGDGDRYPAAIKDSRPTVHREFASRTLRLRYTLLPYLYTLFHKAATDGVPVARPMFFEFPEERDAKMAEEQFMWGSALLIVPCLNQNATTVVTWIPPVVWYELKTGRILEDPTSKEDREDNWVQLPSPQFSLNTFLRSGYVIPLHGSCNCTTICRQTPFTLLVGLACSLQNYTECTANGSLYLDDGESLNSDSFTVSFNVINSSLHIVPENHFGSVLETTFKNKTFSIMIEKIRVYGLYKKPESIIVDDDPINDPDGEPYDSFSRTLTINTYINLTSYHQITWF